MARIGIMAIFGRWLGGLRRPYLFLIVGTLLLAHVLIPDPLPFVDELILLVLTTILGSMKRQSAHP